MSKLTYVVQPDDGAWIHGAFQKKDAEIDLTELEAKYYAPPYGSTLILKDELPAAPAAPRVVAQDAATSESSTEGKEKSGRASRKASDEK